MELLKQTCQRTLPKGLQKFQNYLKMRVALVTGATGQVREAMCICVCVCACIYFYSNLSINQVCAHSNRFHPSLLKSFTILSLNSLITWSKGQLITTESSHHRMAPTWLSSSSARDTRFMGSSEEPPPSTQAVSVISMKTLR